MSFPGAEAHEAAQTVCDNTVLKVLLTRRGCSSSTLESLTMSLPGESLTTQASCENSTLRILLGQYETNATSDEQVTLDEPSDDEPTSAPMMSPESLIRGQDNEIISLNESTHDSATSPDKSNQIEVHNGIAHDAASASTMECGSDLFPISVGTHSFRDFEIRRPKGTCDSSRMKISPCAPAPVLREATTSPEDMDMQMSVQFFEERNMQLSMLVESLEDRNAKLAKQLDVVCSTQEWMQTSSEDLAQAESLNEDMEMRIWNLMKKERMVQEHLKAEEVMCRTIASTDHHLRSELATSNSFEKQLRSELAATNVVASNAVETFKSELAVSSTAEKKLRNELSNELAATNKRNEQELEVAFTESGAYKEEHLQLMEMNAKLDFDNDMWLQWSEEILEAVLGKVPNPLPNESEFRTPRFQRLHALRASFVDEIKRMKYAVHQGCMYQELSEARHAELLSAQQMIEQEEQMVAVQKSELAAQHTELGKLSDTIACVGEEFSRELVHAQMEIIHEEEVAYEMYPLELEDAQSRIVQEEEVYCKQEAALADSTHQELLHAQRLIMQAEEEISAQNKELSALNAHNETQHSELLQQQHVIALEEQAVSLQKQEVGTCKVRANSWNEARESELRSAQHLLVQQEETITFQAQELHAFTEAANSINGLELHLQQEHQTAELQKKELNLIRATVETLKGTINSEQATIRALRHSIKDEELSSEWQEATVHSLKHTIKDEERSIMMQRDRWQKLEEETVAPALQRLENQISSARDEIVESRTPVVAASASPDLGRWATQLRLANERADHASKEGLASRRAEAQATFAEEEMAQSLQRSQRRSEKAAALISELELSLAEERSTVQHLRSCLLAEREQNRQSVPAVTGVSALEDNKHNGGASPNAELRKLREENAMLQSQVGFFQCALDGVALAEAEMGILQDTIRHRQQAKQAATMSTSRKDQSPPRQRPTSKKSQGIQYSIGSRSSPLSSQITTPVRQADEAVRNASPKSRDEARSISPKSKPNRKALSQPRRPASSASFKADGPFKVDDRWSSPTSKKQQAKASLGQSTASAQDRAWQDLSEKAKAMLAIASDS